MSTLVFGVSTLDPATYAAGAAVLGAIALLATYVPAHRAARAEPLAALRSEV
jgi:ABC-type lipoprotein release transport system permease subunit